MVNFVSAVVVCGSVFLRDTISENLQSRSVEILLASASLADIPSDCSPSIVVAVETTPGELYLQNEDIADLASRFDHWLAIGSLGYGSLFHRLRSVRSDVSGLPLDIGKDEIFHAVSLAALSDTLCVRSANRRHAPKELYQLNQAGLDKGQWTILKMLADGATNKHIAQEFDCDEGRVKGMVRRLLASINADNRTQAAVIAARAGL